MKSSQNSRVLEYMRLNGSINPLQALGDLGVMRLASRINDLKKMGYPIRKETSLSVNRFGESVTFATYYLEERRSD